MAKFRALAIALAALVPLAASWQLISHSLVSPSGMLATAAVMLAGLALALLAHGARIAARTARPLTSRTRALREKSKGARFQRQLNPDADGHARPRAPGTVPAAA